MSVVQFNHASGFGQTITVGLNAANVTAGNQVIVALGLWWNSVDSQNVVNSISDNLGNVYTPVIVGDGTVSPGKCICVWSANTINGGFLSSLTVSLPLTNPANYAIHIEERDENLAAT